jgi:hypothetical protein
MIKLDVAEYCHRCPGFDVNVVKKTYDGYYRTGQDFVIGCKHEEKCNVIKDYLERNAVNEDAR